jgi:hypothetical protein
METIQIIKGIGVNINTDIETTNFNQRITKEEAERLLLLYGEFLPFEIMCKEYGQDDDWIGLTPDDLDEDTLLLDDDCQTFEIWADGDKQQAGFKYATIFWKEKAYKCREVADPENPGFDLTIAPEALGEILRDEFGQDFEGCMLDKQIFFYASPDEMLLSVEHLYKLAI